ncbi:hypothetical protein RRG08_050296 [Elysia crispata]|uniref:Uncharacterized protein n=1 Tax=Elysia crispata TaxID=231223 RepID=A0AAE0ZY90_9GAST|nr:hypothetical protein RRG08_050296 [Elysia crispata]
MKLSQYDSTFGLFMLPTSFIRAVKLELGSSGAGLSQKFLRAEFTVDPAESGNLLAALHRRFPSHVCADHIRRMRPESVEMSNAGFGHILD